MRLWLSGLHPARLRASWRWWQEQKRLLERRRSEPRLTVAVDVSPFWEPLTGIGWYLYRLLAHLADRDDVRLRLYGPDLVDKGDQPPPVVNLPDGPALEWVRWRIPEDFSVVHYWLADRLRARESWLIDRDHNDLLFAPNFLPPPRFTGCTAPLVATVHDLSVLRVPETMRDSTRAQLEAGLRDTVDRALAVLTDSEAVRDEIVEEGLASAGRVFAVPLAPASGLADLEPSAATPAAADVAEFDEGGLPDRFVLFVGTIEPRKNLGLLLDAWRLLWRRRQDVVLVLAGGMGWKSEGIAASLRQAVEEGWLRTEGYTSDARLAALYRHAEWLVLPSLYEGFGLPAVEAMVAGVPLLLSDIPVLREVAGDAAFYAPPDDVDAWVELFERVLADETLRADMARRAHARASIYDWRRTADATVAVWHRALDRAPYAATTASS